MNTINFAIDLGTTNSLIAKASGKTLEVYKNPIGHKETLPSVVGFRGNKILVGDKAREYVEKDPENVFAGFKRKMGTTEMFFVKNLNENRSAIDLSALILKELKNFVHTDQQIPSVVITIPASFDTVQSNATKKAGYDAGFKEVVLLQEPIAACLAFANKQADVERKGKWLVYDLGGGTFDVAIVSISPSELSVLDHKGNNFLGGIDFDNLMVETILLPQIYKQKDFAFWADQQREKTIEFKKLYYVLLHKAEQAKKELSAHEQTEVEISLVDVHGHEQDLVLEVNRKEFNRCIEPKALYTIDLIHELLERNNFLATEIEQVVLVGGSTYIPLVRQLIEQKLKLSVDTSLDPTTAVVVGAAQYAEGKRSTYTPDVTTPSGVSHSINSALRARTSYLKTSMDLEELFMANLEGDLTNVSYRIQREDGGFDTGSKKASERLREYLPLVPGELNRFHLRLFDQLNNRIELDCEPIDITQGKYSIHGQPLPNDISLEVDNLQERTTRLELVFSKNSVLPLKKKIYREVSKTIYRTSKEKLIVNILEGPNTATPSSNQVIGVIEINAEDLSGDIIKGSDLEIQLEISESRDISVHVYVSLTDQEFKNTFSPSERYVSLSKLEEELSILKGKIKKELKEYEAAEDFELAGKLAAFLEEGTQIRTGLTTLNDSLNADEKYHLEERKRKLAQKFDALGKNKKLLVARVEYFDYKERIKSMLTTATDIKNKIESDFNKIVNAEPTFIASESALLIESKVKEMRSLYGELCFNNRETLIIMFHNLSARPLREYTNQNEAAQLITKGEGALSRQNYTELKVVNLSLLHLLPEREEESFIKNFKGTGIG